MSNLVIVALPEEDDYVNQLSSEKVAHLTILFLGDVLKVQNLSSIWGYLEHAASRSLSRFGLEVDRRGTLGEDDADVLFFSMSKWGGVPELIDFRNFLLQEPNIKTAFDSVQQHDEFIPHLTMGYPKSPAKKDTRDYPGIHYVSFDRIALWIDNYDGPEYPLKTNDWGMAMSDAVSVGADAVSEILHFGTKGMRWGVRNGSGSPSAAKPAKDKTVVEAKAGVSSSGKAKVDTKGGSHIPPHVDAVNARVSQQRLKKSGLDALSNKELQALALRLNLEQQVNRLQANTPQSGVDKFINGLKSDASKQVSDFATQQATLQIAALMKKK